jgi:hypothetical protein
MWNNPEEASTLQQLLNLPPETISIQLEAGLEEADLGALARFSELTTLSLRFAATLGAFHRIATIPTLKVLTLHGAADWSGLRSLAHLALRKLHLRGPIFTDADVKHVAALDSLAELSVSGTKALAGPGLERLAELPLLSAVYLSYLERLGDSAVAALPGLPALKVLWLTHLPTVTDEGFALLASCQKLSTLTIFGCPQLTRLGALHLKKSLPRTQAQIKWIPPPPGWWPKWTNRSQPLAALTLDLETSGAEVRPVMNLSDGRQIPFPWQSVSEVELLEAFPGRPGPVFNQRVPGWQVVIIARQDRYHILHHDPDGRKPIANVSCPRGTLDAQIPALKARLARLLSVRAEPPAGPAPEEDRCPDR